MKQKIMTHFILYILYILYMIKKSILKQISGSCASFLSYNLKIKKKQFVNLINVHFLNSEQCGILDQSELIFEDFLPSF